MSPRFELWVYVLRSDPRLVAAARELKDRWLEQVNEYEIARVLPEPQAPRAFTPLQLPAAA